MIFILLTFLLLSSNFVSILTEAQSNESADIEDAMSFLALNAQLMDLFKIDQSDKGLLRLKVLVKTLVDLDSMFTDFFKDEASKEWHSIAMIKSALLDTLTRPLIDEDLADLWEENQLRRIAELLRRSDLTEESWRFLSKTLLTDPSSLLRTVKFIKSTLEESLNGPMPLLAIDQFGFFQTSARVMSALDIDQLSPAAKVTLSTPASIIAHFLDLFKASISVPLLNLEMHKEAFVALIRLPWEYREDTDMLVDLVPIYRNLFSLFALAKDDMRMAGVKERKNPEDFDEETHKALLSFSKMSSVKWESLISAKEHPEFKTDYESNLGSDLEDTGSFSNENHSAIYPVHAMVCPSLNPEEESLMNNYQVHCQRVAEAILRAIKDSEDKSISMLTLKPSSNPLQKSLPLIEFVRFAELGYALLGPLLDNPACDPDGYNALMLALSAHDNGHLTRMVIYGVHEAKTYWVESISNMIEEVCIN